MMYSWFNVFNHCTRCGIIFFLYILVVILFWNETLNIQSLQLILKKCRLLWDPSPLCKRNRCEESETREEEILKALEHHQTGKTPTHNRAEKALRSSQASLNGSLSANCATQPPQRTTLLLLPTQICMSAEWTSGRACSLSLWSFHFTASDSSPKCCDIYLRCDVSMSCYPSPFRKLLVTWNTSKRNISTLLTESRHK